MKNLKFNTKEHNLFFTGDSHYNHKNIIKGTTVWKDIENTRNFDTIENMNNMIIDEINNKIGQNDILFHLGDWSFGHPSNVKWFRTKIHCKNIYLLIGNHDNNIRKNKDNIQSLFSSVQDYMEIRIDNIRIILMHYPIHSWAGKNKGSIHLFGHTHSKYGGSGKSLDVGIDNYFKLFGSYSPFSYKEIQELIENKFNKL